MSQYFKKLFLIFCCVFSLGVASFKKVEKIVVSGDDLSFRSASFFAGSTNKLGNLEVGAEAKIIGYDTDKREGVGIKVKITKGKRKGQTGWVYYNYNKPSRLFKLLDYNNREVVPEKVYEQVKNSGNTTDTHREFFFKWFRWSKEYKDSVNNSNYVKTIEETPIAYDKTVQDMDKAWTEVKNGTYKIDLDNYEGGPMVPILVPIVDNKFKTFWIRRDYNQLLNVATKAVKSVGQKSEKDCPQRIIKEVISPLAVESSIRPKPRPERLAPLDGHTYLKGCEPLKKSNLSSTDNEKLKDCWESIQKALISKAGNSLDRTKTFKALYSALNPKEQRFMAMVLTARGEAGILSRGAPEEMRAIMKVIDNRVAQAKVKVSDPKINELDVVLQKSQFSMYNSNKNDWRKNIKAHKHDTFLGRAINAFTGLKNAKFEPKDKISKVTHYHTTYVKPAWRKSSKLVDVKVDGKELKGKHLRYIAGSKKTRLVQHKFYRNIPWDFSYNNWR